MCARRLCAQVRTFLERAEGTIENGESQCASRLRRRIFPKQSKLRRGEENLAANIVNEICTARQTSTICTSATTGSNERRLTSASWRIFPELHRSSKSGVISGTS